MIKNRMVDDDMEFPFNKRPWEQDDLLSTAFDYGFNSLLKREDGKWIINAFAFVQVVYILFNFYLIYMKKFKLDDPIPYVSLFLLHLILLAWTLTYCAQGVQLNEGAQGMRDLLWSHKSGTRESERRIVFNSKLFRIAVVSFWYIHKVSSFVFGIFVWLKDSDVVVSYCSEAVGMKYKFVLHLVATVYLQLCLGSIMINFVIFYFVLHAINQLYLLEECLVGLSNGFENYVDEMLFYNRCYQDDVHRRLMFIIKRHTYGIPIVTAHHDATKLIILVNTFIAIILSGILFFFIFGPKINLAIFGILGIFILLTWVYVFTTFGELVENEGEVFYDLLRFSKWYTFDKHNQKLFMLLLFIARQQQSKFVTLTEEFRANYTLCLAIMKAFWKAGNFLYQYKRR